MSKNEKNIIMLKEKLKSANKNKSVNLKIKTCFGCGKEYEEKDNFNWSCKTH